MSNKEQSSHNPWSKWEDNERLREMWGQSPEDWYGTVPSGYKEDAPMQGGMELLDRQAAPKDRGPDGRRKVDPR